MEPRWKNGAGGSEYLGGMERFDFWLDRSTDSSGRWGRLVVLWGPAARWVSYNIYAGSLARNPNYFEAQQPTEQERKHIERYLALFVPELGIKIGEEDEA